MSNNPATRPSVENLRNLVSRYDALFPTDRIRQASGLGGELRDGLNAALDDIAAKDAEIFLLQEDVRCYEAMKHGVAIRIGDLEDRLAAKDARLVAAEALAEAAKEARNNLANNGYLQAECDLSDRPQGELRARQKIDAIHSRLDAALAAYRATKEGK